MSEQHKPKVLNLKSTNYKVPEGAVYIGRAMPRYNLQESKWHNPYHIGKDGSRDKVISMYESYIVIKCLDLPDNYKLSELTGHDLICWCTPLPCHGDILLRLANPDLLKQSIEEQFILQLDEGYLLMPRIFPNKIMTISSAKSSDNDGHKTNTLAARFMDEYWKRCER